MSGERKYRDRKEAGQILAAALQKLYPTPDASILVFGLPRGGVPVAYEISQSLQAPLDVFIVRKLGCPTHEEVAFGALAMGGACVMNEDMSAMISKSDVAKVIAKEQAELARRLEVYRGTRALPDLNDQIVILVDDGIATGATMRAAIESARKMKAKEVTVAVPVAPKDTKILMEKLADKFVCPLVPHSFHGAVGYWYERFGQTEDAEVLEILNKAGLAN